jgi:hypothetical protein
MAAVIYSLCAVTCLVAALLLWRQYRATRFPMLFWSALCFFGLTVNNVLLVLDRLVYTELDLTIPRLACAAISVVLLVYGLIWASE